MAWDVTVVGGGVIGSMHAWFALERGHRVVQIERDPEARSASVRNFGLVWVSGRRDGRELELALRARELWASIGVSVPGLGFRPHGSMTVALDDTELTVMAAYATSPAAADRDTVLLDSLAARRLNPALASTVAGALHCRSDAIVESRVAQRALRTAMINTGRYNFVPNRHVLGLDGTTALDHLGERYPADVVIVCPGAVHDTLVGAHLAAAPVRRCQLQMMQTEPLDVELSTSIADVDSMRYYPAYEHLDLAALPPQAPIAAAARMQLLMVQRLDGSLTIGDTHVYDVDDADHRTGISTGGPMDGPAEPFAFDVDEAPYSYLAERAAAILGRRLPPVRRRWSGVYSQLTAAAAPDAVYHRAIVSPGVVVVTGPGGRGMTLSPAIAEATWEELT